MATSANPLTVDMEIICIGNELLIGKTQDTNAFWLGRQATNLGISVIRVTVVQDIVLEIAKVICEALSRKPNFIITTGGLGPTFDDKTLEGIAKAMESKLEINQKALEVVKDKYIQYAKARNKPIGEMTHARVKMATFPENTESVNNPIGTAPGLRADINGTILFALPGVPSEMEAIFKESIAPILKQAAQGEIFCEASIFVDGIMESDLAPLIDTVMRSNRGIYIKSHPLSVENKPSLEIHFTIRAQGKDKSAETVTKAKNQLLALIKQNGAQISENKNL